MFACVGLECCSVSSEVKVGRRYAQVGAGGPLACCCLWKGVRVQQPRAVAKENGNMVLQAQ